MNDEYKEEDELIRKAVLAENVQVSHPYQRLVEVTFDFLCPNCGHRHWATEIDSSSDLFQTVGWALECGVVNVRMPWVKIAERDAKSIYGQTCG
jgi:hypothetical protein